MAQRALQTGPPQIADRKRRAPGLNWGPYLLILPSAILLVVFTIYPMFSSLYMSLFKANTAYPEPVWTGLGNFRDLFADEIFRKVMKNTLLFTVFTIPASLLLAIFLAVQLNKKIRSVSFLRAAFFYPTMLPLVSAASLWNFMFNPNSGPFIKLLKLFGVTATNWLGSPTLALPAIVLVSIWKDAGYYMIFYLAGLQNLPADLYEAAELDGASPWQQFRRITLPLLSPTTLFVFTISFINTIKTADQIFIMTTGGPDNATNLIMYRIYEYISAFNDRGMGAALTVVLLAILLAVALFGQLFLEKKVHYD